MNEFENVLRSAVDTAATSTVTPPFGVVQHRADVRRRQQIGAIALAITAVLAGGALAVPRMDARQVRPTGSGEVTTYDRYLQCLESHRPVAPTPSPSAATAVSDAVQDACYREVGYDPLPTLTPPITIPTKLLIAPDPTVRPVVPSGSPSPGPGIVTSPLSPPPVETSCGGPAAVNGSVIHGEVATVTWDLVVESPENPARRDCFFMEPLVQEPGLPEGEYVEHDISYDREVSSQNVGYGTWHPKSGETLLGIWAALTPDVVKAKITHAGETVEVATVKHPKIDTFAFLATLYEIESFDVDSLQVVLYDKNGREVR